MPKGSQRPRTNYSRGVNSNPKLRYFQADERARMKGYALRADGSTIRRSESLNPHPKVELSNEARTKYGRYGDVKSHSGYYGITRKHRNPVPSKKKKK